MGLHIASMARLQGNGYEFYILTYGLAPRSPEHETVLSQFSYFADLLGEKGLVVTGSYDQNYYNDFPGFLQEVGDRLFSLSMEAKGDNTKELPVPALVALHKRGEDNIDIAYVSIKNFQPHEIVSAFRRITEAAQEGRISDLDTNLLKRSPKLARNLWKSVQVKPSIYGVGIDLKGFLESIRSDYTR